MCLIIANSHAVRMDRVNPRGYFDHFQGAVSRSSFDTSNVTWLHCGIHAISCPCGLYHLNNKGMFTRQTLSAPLQKKPLRRESVELEFVPIFIVSDTDIEATPISDEHQRGPLRILTSLVWWLRHNGIAVWAVVNFGWLLNI